MRGRSPGVIRGAGGSDRSESGSDPSCLDGRRERSRQRSGGIRERFECAWTVAGSHTASLAGAIAAAWTGSGQTRSAVRDRAHQRKHASDNSRSTRDDSRLGPACGP